METIKINGTFRKETGKSASKHIRYEGKVPCVLYGDGSQVHFSVFEEEFKNLVYTDKAYMVLLDIEGKTYEAVMQDIQCHPVSDIIEHIDFLKIIPNKKIKMDIPVKITGKSPGEMEGGKAMSKLRKLKVKALPEFLPDHIELSVDNVQLGESIQVKDVKIANLEILNSPSNPIVTVSIPKGLVLDTPETEAAAAAVATDGKEGAEAAATGETKTEGGDAKKGADAKKGGDDKKGGEVKKGAEAKKGDEPKKGDKSKGKN